MSPTQTRQGGAGVNLHTWQVGDLLLPAVRQGAFCLSFVQPKALINRGSAHIASCSDTQLSNDVHGEEYVCSYQHLWAPVTCGGSWGKPALIVQQQTQAWGRSGQTHDLLVGPPTAANQELEA